MTRPRATLYWRTLGWLLALSAVLWFVLWLATQHAADTTASQDLDSRLKITATRLLQVSTQVADRGAVVDNARGPEQSLYPDNAMGHALPTAWSRSPDFEITTVDNRVLAGSAHFPAVARTSTPGFEDRTADGIQWRVFTVQDRRRGLTCRVAADQFVHAAHASALGHDFAQPLLWALPVFALIALFSVWRGLAPLRELEHELARQDPNDPQPLAMDDRRAPRELKRLVHTINQLLTRLREVLARQRIFTAAAGHELRTPLAGCRLQAEVARRTRDPDQRENALANIQVSISRMSRLISQLLLLARAEPAASDLQRAELDVNELVAGAVSRRMQDARAKDVTIRVDAGRQRARVKGDRTLLESMFVNVIDNAIQYSPAQSVVEVSVRALDDGVRIVVSDMGPGVAEKERDRVFERFYRGDAQTGSGFGLGLALVEAVARVHRGSARLETTPGGGAQMVIDLPVSGFSPEKDHDLQVGASKFGLD